MDALFTKRVSIRKYQNRPVEQEKIEQMLRAAMAAPSAANQQPWEFYVVTDPDTIQKLSHCTPYTGPARRAPLVFVVCNRNNTIAAHMAQQDMGAAVQNLMLQAVMLDLGTVWMGIAPGKPSMDNVRAIIDMPETLDPFCLVACGYPDEERKWVDRYDASRIHYI